ncbi:hypothetical protein WJX72_002527 [[Myrmecia] bisecta]|uniref:Signal peptide peptidase n=1 Tax=[Myrmecia] bisecta TaxID=41462 RepID=A0AAW1PLB6_9CHLO
MFGQMPGLARGTTASPPCSASCWQRAIHCCSSPLLRRSALLVARSGKRRLQSEKQSTDSPPASTGGPEAKGAREQRRSPTETASSTPSEPVASKQPVWRWEESQDALKAYGLFLGVLAIGVIPGLRELRFVELPYFVGLAALTIYIGAHRGLSTKIRQQITLEQGALAPVAASVALFGGYLLIKFFPDLNLQTLLNAYFWFIGSVAVAGALGAPLRNALGPLGEPSFELHLPEGILSGDDGEPVTSALIAPSDVLVILLSFAAASLDLAANHTNFTLNNLLACLIATDILQLLGLKSFKAAAVMLVGLLAYDVFWVFGSPAVVGDNVMLTVATSNILTGPTRLLFPRYFGSVGEASGFPFSLLGLGDIAVPGLLACLALRYDASRATDMRARAAAAAQAFTTAIAALKPDATSNQIADATASAADAAYDNVAESEAEQRRRTEGTSTSGSTDTVFAASEAVMHQRTYFIPVMVAYVGGLGIAFAANSITHLGQPALLYLVPATFLAIFARASLRGEVRRVWDFSDTSAPLLNKLEKNKLRKAETKKKA